MIFPDIITTIEDPITIKNNLFLNIKKEKSTNLKIAKHINMLSEDTKISYSELIKDEMYPLKQATSLCNLPRI